MFNPVIFWQESIRPNPSPSLPSSPSPSSPANIPSSLIVNISINMYSDGVISSSKQLLERLEKLHLLPIVYTVQHCNNIGPQVFSLVMPFTNNQILRVTISPDHHWTILINDIRVKISNNTVLKFNGREIIDSCKQLLCLLNELTHSDLCIGNPDPKFFCIRDRRKGTFQNRLGM